MVYLVGNSGPVPSAANRIFTSAFLLKFLSCLGLKIEMRFMKKNNQTFTRTKRTKKLVFSFGTRKSTVYFPLYFDLFQYRYFTILSIFFSSALSISSFFTPVQVHKNLYWEQYCLIIYKCSHITCWDPNTKYHARA